MSTESEALLRRAYAAFNARDIDAAISVMHPDVDWPNAFEGGREHGHEAVRAYWTRQFKIINSHVEPESFDQQDGQVTVTVHQVVRDANTGDLLSEQRVKHVYTLRDDLIVRMDVLEA
jgi:hypothetical protein